jgi:DNA polymerase-3 subunit alpha
MAFAIRTSPGMAASAPGAGPRFVHLKVHSAYSLLEGALPIERIAKLAADHGFPAIGLSDTNNLFGALEFSEKLAEAGIQPIVGVSIAIDFGERKPDPRIMPGTPLPRVSPHRDGLIALYAMSEAGYANLMKLVSRAHLGTAGAHDPHVKLADLAEHNAGLIALSGGPDGPVDQALRNGRQPDARVRLDALAAVFGDRLYVELQRHGLASEIATEPQLHDLSYTLGLPLVATNEVLFATPDDHEAHDALLCIADGTYVVEDKRRRATPQHFFKSAEEMAALFADLPEALDNTVEIARRCAFRPEGRKPILPGFVVTEAGASAEERLAAEAAELARQSRDGLAERLASQPAAPGFGREDYEKRLSYELDVISKMKFPGYFLIVADFIKWAKAHAIPVGPGRGSGAGSVVAWALTITDLDPLRFGLLFERFLNPERLSMPDFDIDFCQDRRDEVIRYVQEKYGHDRVAQIITHGKLQARAVLRDVGRVLQMPYGQIDKLCKLVPNNPASPVTLRQAIEAEPRLAAAANEEPAVARLLEISEKLEGLYRHASTHAAGMVIADRPLDELVPLYRDPKSSMPVTQFNWKMVEAAGLVKFDFLGLKTLTVLQRAVELIKRGRGIDLDLARVPIEGTSEEARRAYGLLAQADTVGVFQLESTGMRESLKRLKPDRFEDIIAMVALYRPGPMDNIPTYINRKHGLEPIDCLHPMLEGILKETYGVIIYQEQVIQIAQVMGGYTLGQADLLRRAMGKKDKAGMARQQARFVEGAVARGVGKADAVYIFELVDKFAGYGFNKSHAAAYALVAFHTAYLKANFRGEFLAASMTLDMANTDKLAMFAAEARRSGIEILPPCVNASGVEFGVEIAPGTVGRTEAGASAGRSPTSTHPESRTSRSAQPDLRAAASSEPGAIRYSLAALKSIGAGAVETIVAERGQGGRFKDLSDFARRLDAKALNRRALEALAAAGCFDTLEANRALVHANVDQMLALSQRLAQNTAAGMADLFGGTGPSAGPQIDLRQAKSWTPAERLEKELEAVGFFLSGHPLDAYQNTLEGLGVRTWAEFQAATERGAAAGRLAGIVVSSRERRSQKSGNKYAFAVFSDPSGQFEAVIFADTLAQAGDLLEAGTPVVISVEAERDGETVKLRAQRLEALETAAAGLQRGVRIRLDDTRLNGRAGAVLGELRGLLAAGGPPSGKGGEVRVVIEIAERGHAIEVAIPGRYDTGPQARGLLSTVPGVIEVAEM